VRKKHRDRKFRAAKKIKHLSDIKAVVDILIHGFGPEGLHVNGTPEGAAARYDLTVGVPLKLDETLTEGPSCVPDPCPARNLIPRRAELR
jgi:hypothetical protein